jgi:hypothetical protein
MLKKRLSIGVRGQLHLCRSPAAEVKGASITCQAKGPELVIGEIKYREYFLPDPGKFQCRLEGYLVVIEEHATIS